MAISDEFIAFVVDQMSVWADVTVRKMFGGAGLYRDGRMFGLIADDVVYLKVDNTNRGMFEEVGCRPFKPFTDKPMKMPYFEIPADVLESPVELAAWAERSYRVACATD